MAMTTLQLAGGRKDTEVEENGGDTLQSRPTSLLSPRTSRPGLHLGEKVDRDATRCELKRLLTTAETNEKKKEVIFALDQLEGLCRGTALAFIVNEALATATAVVGGGKKRRDTFAGHGHARNGTDAFGRFDRDKFASWQPSDRHNGNLASHPGAGGIRPGSEGPTGSLTEPNALARSGEGKSESARRFSVPILPSIPENRVPGRRVVVKQISDGSVEDVTWEDYKIITSSGGLGIEKNPLAREKERSPGELALPALQSLAVLPCREEVAEVPQALIGEATSTGVDPSHPPWAAVDGGAASFWLSTGLFPQTLTIRLQRPVIVYEVMVECAGVNAARVLLNDSTTSPSNSRSSSSSSRTSWGNGGEAGVSGSAFGMMSAWDRWQEGSLELVGEQLSDAANRRGDSFARMVFRAPGKERLQEVDRLSLVVMSGRTPFCLVSSVAIRGQLGVADEDEEDMMFQ